MSRQKWCHVCERWIRGNDVAFQRHLDSKIHKKANEIRLFGKKK